MARQVTSTDALRERLTSLLADWGAEMSMLLRELDEAQRKLSEQNMSSETHGRDLKTLEDRVSGQAELIETLRAEAATAQELRAEVRTRDLEVEKLASEVETKQELIRVLRRDAEALQKEHRRAEQARAELGAELLTLRESAENHGNEGTAELEALRAELEARKALIKSLRADADRAGQLESRLEENREIIANLEASINKHAETIAELKRTSEQWKKKYQDLRGRGGASTATVGDLPTLSEADVAALQQLDSTDIITAMSTIAINPNGPERTIAIDMRRPLSEARRKTGQTPNKS